MVVIAWLLLVFVQVIVFVVALPMLAFAGIGLLRLSPKLSLRWTLPTIHTLLVLAIVIPSFFGKGFDEPPFADMYSPFFYYPGPLVLAVERSVGGSAWPWLNRHLGERAGAYTVFVAIPALTTAVLGALFWFLLSHYVTRKCQVWDADTAPPSSRHTSRFSQRAESGTAARIEQARKASELER